MTRLAGRSIEAFIPDLGVWEGILTIIAGTKAMPSFPFQLNARSYGDGVIYGEDDVQITACHNKHLGDSEPFRSFSFRIEAGSKAIVYSGDDKSIDDFAQLIDGCEFLLMETGHHKVEDVCVYLRDSMMRFGQLGFIHHGRAILRNAEMELRKAREILGDKVFIANDGMVKEL
jgi:ribonuclease BN (tRNA processing enzyme)